VTAATIDPPRCVVFDIDDTLYLERDYVRSGFEAVGAWAERELGLVGFSEAAWADFVAGRRGDVFDDVLRDHGVTPTRDVIEAMVVCYRSHRPRISLLPDAAALVERIREAVALAAITDGPLQSQRAKAEALQLSEWAELVVYTEELGSGYGKPHPRAFQLVEEEFGTRGWENVYLADNPAKDFSGPRSLGWRTVRVRRPESLHVTVACGGDVDVEVEDLTSLASVLGFGRDSAVAT
jgi:putative hydrolase of the HAD superfamily